MAKKKEMDAVSDRELLWVPPSKLVPYENNPRLNAASVDYVANSIRELGFGAPIIVDRDYVIIAGHTRLQAALKLELPAVPVVVLNNITPDQAKAMRLADNKAGEQSGWDFDALDIELDDLDGVFNMEDFGFLDQKYEDFNDDAEEDDAIPTERSVERESYSVIVELPSEDAQRAFLERMINEGYACRMG